MLFVQRKRCPCRPELECCLGLQLAPAQSCLAPRHNCGLRARCVPVRSRLRGQACFARSSSSSPCRSHLVWLVRSVGTPTVLRGFKRSVSGRTFLESVRLGCWCVSSSTIGVTADASKTLKTPCSVCAVLFRSGGSHSRKTSASATLFASDTLYGRTLSVAFSIQNLTRSKSISSPSWVCNDSSARSTDCRHS